VTYPSRAEVIQYTSPQLEILTVPSQCQEGPDCDADDDDAGEEVEFLSLKKYLSTKQNHHQSDRQISQAPKPELEATQPITP